MVDCPSFVLEGLKVRGMSQQKFGPPWWFQCLLVVSVVSVEFVLVFL